MIVDCHAHLANPGFFPSEFIDGIIDNLITTIDGSVSTHRRAALRRSYLEAFEDRDCDGLLREMDEAGIERVCLLIIDFEESGFRPKLDLATIFEEHSRIVLAHPDRFVVFAGVDPRKGPKALEFLRRGHADFGFQGLKLYPPCGFMPGSDIVEPLYEYCTKFNLPILVHIGPTVPCFGFEYSTPYALEPAVRRFPHATFILAHGAVKHIEDSISMARYRPNVYLDLSGYQVEYGRETLVDKLNELFEKRVNHKLLWGTDWPIFRMFGGQKTFLSLLTQPFNEGKLAIAPSEFHAIMGTTFCNLTGIQPA